MKLETVLLAVGDTDRDRTGTLAETAAAIAGPAGATVKLLHVFTREEYRAARADLDGARAALQFVPDPARCNMAAGVGRHAAHRHPRA